MLGDRARRDRERIEEEIRLAMVERDPNDDKNVIVEIQGGAGRRGGGPVGRRPLPDALQVRRAPRLQDRAARRRRRQVHVRDQGRRRLLASSSSRAARTASSACRRPSPRAASTRRTATVAVLPEAEDVDVHDRPQRPRGRRLPLVRARRPVRQHDRLGRADHAQAERRRGLDAGREEPAAEPREGDARAARAALRARARRAAGRAGRRPPLAGRHRRPRREDPHLQLPASGRVTDHRVKLTVHDLDRVLEGELDEFTAALEADEKRRRLEAQAAAGVSRSPASPVRDALDSARIAIAARRVATRRASTPSCCSRTRSASTARALIMDPDRGRRGPGGPHASRTSSGAGASAASRSPTCSARRAFATSTCTSTRACSSRGPRPSCSSRSALDAAAGRARASTSARAAARSRWRSSTSGPDLLVTGSDASAGRARGRARERASASASTSTFVAGRPARRPRRRLGRRPRQPAVRRRGRRRDAAARARATSRAGRCSRGADGLDVIRRLVAAGRGDGAAAGARGRRRARRAAVAAAARGGSPTSRCCATSPASSAWW